MGGGKGKGKGRGEGGKGRGEGLGSGRGSGGILFGERPAQIHRFNQSPARFRSPWHFLAFSPAHDSLTTTHDRDTHRKRPPLSPNFVFSPHTGPKTLQVPCLLPPSLQRNPLKKPSPKPTKNRGKKSHSTRSLSKAVRSAPKQDETERNAAQRLAKVVSNSNKPAP